MTISAAEAILGGGDYSQSPGRYQHFEGWTKFAAHWEPEISGDGEGDPIWKLSNTNKTGGGAGRQRILN